MKVFNKRYWPYQFKMLPEPDAWKQMCRLEAYCIDNFPHGTWRNDGLNFVFKRKEDATLFLLKWGG